MRRDVLTITLRKQIRCNIILVLLGWDQSVTGYPFLKFLTQAFIVVTGINWKIKSQALKTWLFLFYYLRSAISLIAGLFYFHPFLYGRLSVNNQPFVAQSAGQPSFLLPDLFLGRDIVIRLLLKGPGLFLSTRS